MRKFLKVFFVALSVLIAGSAHAAPLNASLIKKISGPFHIILSPYCPVDTTNCLVYSNPSSNFSQLLTVSKTGKISGVWGKSDTLIDLFNPIESDVKFTGKVKSISKSGSITKATFSATGSDGSTVRGTITHKKVSIVNVFSFKAKIKVSTSAGEMTGSILGVRKGF